MGLITSMPSLTHRWLVVLALVLAGGCESSPTGPGSTSIYAALGASDAVGIGASPPAAGYVYVLSRRLNGARHGGSLHNFGINGALVDEIGGTALEQAIAVHPSVVTVWTGSNDVIRGASADTFAASLDRILAELRARTNATVFVADLVDLTEAPLFRVLPDADVTTARVAAFNQRIATAVAARSCVLVRLSTIPIDNSMFAEDGFHPNNEGYRRIADAFWTEMQRVGLQQLHNEAMRH